MILFIDTHDSLITVGLKIDNKLFIKNKESEYSHSIFTMSLIKELFDENEANIKELDTIIVVNGPGSFTGIRIGLTIAKTLAYTLKTKIISISSLTAYLISSESSTDKMCIINDPKGYYVSVFDKDNNVIIPECYADNDNFEYPLIVNKLNINRIIDYCKNRKSDDVHHIKANYVKKIEVEND